MDGRQLKEAGMRRRLLLKTGLVALLGVAAFVGYLWWTIPSSGINRTSANRIREGKSLHEVEAIIGLPAGDYRTKEFSLRTTAVAQITVADELVRVVKARNGLRIEEWLSDEGAIVVAVDREEQVFRSVWVSFSDSFLDKVRAWLRLN